MGISMWLLLAARAFSAPHFCLTDRQMENARDNLPIYERVGRMTGVPALAVAAIHYEESDMEPMYIGTKSHRFVRVVGGPFMLDCGGKTREEFRRRIRVYEQQVAKRFHIWPVPRVSRDFDFAALCAAYELSTKARGPFWNILGQVNRAVMADALWGYHGRARYESGWQRSPYVSNDPHRGVQFVDRSVARPRLCSRPGALVIYDELQRRM